MREPKPIHVPLIVSWLEKSERTSLEFSPDEEVAVGQKLDLGDTRIAITAIESVGRRVAGLRARDADTTLPQRVDQVRVKFSVNKSNRIVPIEVLAATDEELEVGVIVH